jgi:hypothetical protein
MATATIISLTSGHAGTDVDGPHRRGAIIRLSGGQKVHVRIPLSSDDADRDELLDMIRAALRDKLGPMADDYEVVFEGDTYGGNLPLKKARAWPSMDATLRKNRDWRHRGDAQSQDGTANIQAQSRTERTPRYQAADVRTGESNVGTGLTTGQTHGIRGGQAVDPHAQRYTQSPGRELRSGRQYAAPYQSNPGYHVASSQGPYQFDAQGNLVVADVPPGLGNDTGTADFAGISEFRRREILSMSPLGRLINVQETGEACFGEIGGEYNGGTVRGISEAEFLSANFLNQEANMTQEQIHQLANMSRDELQRNSLGMNGSFGISPGCSQDTVDFAGRKTVNTPTHFVPSWRRGEDYPRGDGEHFPENDNTTDSTEKLARLERERNETKRQLERAKGRAAVKPLSEDRRRELLEASTLGRAVLDRPDAAHAHLGRQRIGGARNRGRIVE